MEDRIKKFFREVEEIERHILDYSLSKNINGNKELIFDFIKRVKSENFLNEDVFKAESEFLSKLVPGAAVSIGVYNKEKNAIVVKAVSGLKAFFESLMKFGGINLVEKEFPLEDSLATVLLNSGKIHKVPKGLKDVALKKVPDAIVNFMDDILGPFYVYSGGLTYEDNLIGNVVVMIRGNAIGGEISEIIDRMLPLFGVINHYYLNR